MSDYLFAIWADRNTCKPYNGPGCVGHVVRVSTSDNMTVINEFLTGGPLAHVACAPSCLQSWFIDKTSVKTTIGQIEIVAGTTYPNGTAYPGIQRAITAFGQGSQISNMATPGNIMNPGGGYIDPGSSFQAYLAARQGGLDCLQLIPTPIPVPTPEPPEDEMPPYLATTGVRPSGETLDPHGQGAVYLVAGPFKRWISNAAYLSEYETVYGQPKNFSTTPFVLDHMVELPPIDANYPVLGWTRSIP